MKNLGLAIALIGIIIIGCALTFTPIKSFNVADSEAGLKASAAIFFSAIVVFGAGVVMYANAVMPKGKK